MEFDHLRYSEYFILESKIPKIFSYTFIIFIITLLFIFFIFYFKYDSYYINNGIISNGLMRIYTSPDDIQKITRNNNIVINDKKYKYKVYSISDIMYINGSLDAYQEVYIKGTFNNDYNILNESMLVKINYRRDYIYKYLIDFLKGGRK